MEFPECIFTPVADNSIEYYSIWIVSIKLSNPSSNDEEGEDETTCPFYL